VGFECSVMFVANERDFSIGRNVRLIFSLFNNAILVRLHIFYSV
jgi:hypothetical protein